MEGVVTMLAAVAGEDLPQQQPRVTGFFDMLERFNVAFSLFDVDGDGKLTVDEIGDVLRELGQEVSDEDLREIIEEFDENQNGQIDFDEFLWLMTRRAGVKDSVPDLMRAAASAELARQSEEATDGEQEHEGA